MILSICTKEIERGENIYLCTVWNLTRTPRSNIQMAYKRTKTEKPNNSDKGDGENSKRNQDAHINSKKNKTVKRAKRHTKKTSKETQINEINKRT